MTQKIIDGTEIAKRAAGEAAAILVQEGMTVGLGTGSTTSYFIESLGKRCKAGLNICAFASSEGSTREAIRHGIPLLESNAVTTLNITVDGADEIDPSFNMIKGGGGALLREKLLAKASKEMIVIVDSTKQVAHLGKHFLPIEIVPFMYLNTLLRLQEMGYRGALRVTRGNKPYLTDNNNYIFDIHYPSPIIHPEKEHHRLKEITGVIETGLFFHLAKRVIVGYEDGSVKIVTK